MRDGIDTQDGGTTGVEGATSYQSNEPHEESAGCETRPEQQIPQILLRAPERRRTLGNENPKSAPRYKHEGNDSDTQLHLIRDLMLAASRRGAWLTLGEIAGLTEIGEASISAQLRHLRKLPHGGHVVEKRRRKARLITARLAASARRGQNKPTVLEAAKWEYRVSRRRDADAKDDLTSGAAGVGARQTQQDCAGGSYAEAGA